MATFQNYCQVTEPELNPLPTNQMISRPKDNTVFTIKWKVDFSQGFTFCQLCNSAVIVFFSMVAFCCPTAVAQTSNNTKVANGTRTVSDFEGDNIPKAVITVAALTIFFSAAVALAKLVDYLYDRRAISDDASDISDYTKEILKAQMMMMVFNRNRQKNKKLTTEEVVKKYSKMWRAKVARNKARRMKLAREDNKVMPKLTVITETKDENVVTMQKPIANQGTSGLIGTSIAGLNTPQKAALSSQSNGSIGSKVTVPNGTGAKNGNVKVNNQSSNNQTNKSSNGVESRQGNKGNSRPITSGLKSRPVSAKTLKSPSVTKLETSKK